MDDRLPNLLAAAAQLLTDAVEGRTTDVVGRGASAPAALVALTHDPGEPIDTLRHTLRLTHSGAVRLIDRLEADGLVRRRRSGGRTVVVELTDEGRRRVDEIEAARLDAARAALAGVPEALREPLQQALSALLAAHTHDRADLRRICRSCSFEVCDRCPVAAAAS